MLIGLCGGICSGKNSVAEFLTTSHRFSRLHLLHHQSLRDDPGSHDVNRSTDVKVRSFTSVESLLDFVTKQWKQRWVTTDIWSEEVLESLLRRPSFILVSVDAPVSLRWKRSIERCARREQAPPTLEDFVIQNDDHLYDQKLGLACLIDRAEVRLINQTSSIDQLHKALEDLNLANEERLRPNWDQYFMQLASLAAQRSNCMKRRVGCVLVQERRVISTGYNGTPRNLKNCNEGGCARCNAGHKAGVSLSTCLCIHAEENALLEAGRERIRDGSILYCNTCPCLTCSVKIAQVGISEVVYFQGYGIDKDATAVLEEGGVGLRQFSPSVPHIGWNSAATSGTAALIDKTLYGLRKDSKYYYVHSYTVPYREGLLEREGWNVATAKYGTEQFGGAVAKGKLLAQQFHPEKIGVAGLRVLKAFLEGRQWENWNEKSGSSVSQGLTRRVIACLDVRTNDQGDLVVTKGDKYDVREKGGATCGGQIRNLGKPVDIARKYYEQGSDEITFLNIASFRNCPLVNLPMLEILRRTSENVFVPLTIGGGIGDTMDTDGTKILALEVATLYFNSGADKNSIGLDAVLAAEEYYKRGRKIFEKTAIEQIAAKYGNQAVVVSVDLKRVYVKSLDETRHHTINTKYHGPLDEHFCWYQCTIKGGREARDLDVRELVTAVEAMGAGEILLNCIDKDGRNGRYDLELIRDVKAAIKRPVISLSGAGNPVHFEELFEQTTTDAALGAGMFHRGEYSVKEVKDVLSEKGVRVRKSEDRL